MESFFSRYKNALVLILVLLVQVIGVAVQVRRPLPKEHAQPDAGGVRLIRYWAVSLVSPPERLLHWIGSGVLGVWDNYIDLIHVKQQNQDLQSELKRLRIEEGGISEDARQGQRLQQLLAFKERYIYKTLPAQIIGTSGIDQSRILYIDKGSKDGVAVDMPVITPDGIVGRVREVFPHTCQVLEISDPTSGAGVILADTRIRGILRGNALGQPQVVGVMPDDRIKPGERVVTSGGDQIYPRGLAVGVVDHVVVDPERDPLIDVVIHPAANLSRLEEVLVVTDMGADITPKEKLDLVQSQAIADVEQLKASEVLAERLPSRIDPDAPKSEQSTTNDESADGGIARPIQPPAAVHPDHFSPNSTPAADSLTPGARAAALLEGTGNKTTASTPKPHAVVPGSNGEAAETATAPEDAPVQKKKTPELVPDDGSRPPSGMLKQPAPSGTDEGENTAGRAPVAVQDNAARPSRPPVNSPDNLAGRPARSITSQSSTQSSFNGAAPTAAAPKTKIVTDGPVSSPAKKTTTPAANATSTQKTASTPTQKPPVAATQHKGPELVPDDGSRPPATMKAKPQPQNTPAQPQGSPQR
jgi:rod shape-determining protein MreC